MSMIEGVSKTRFIEDLSKALSNDRGHAIDLVRNRLRGRAGPQANLARDESWGNLLRRPLQEVALSDAIAVVCQAVDELKARREYDGILEGLSVLYDLSRDGPDSQSARVIGTSVRCSARADGRTGRLRNESCREYQRGTQVGRSVRLGPSDENSQAALKLTDPTPGK
jgi:hypothetical protein